MYRDRRMYAGDRLDPVLRISLVERTRTRFDNFPSAPQFPHPSRCGDASGAEVNLGARCSSGPNGVIQFEGFSLLFQSAETRTPLHQESRL